MGIFGDGINSLIELASNMQLIKNNNVRNIPQTESKTNKNIERNNSKFKSSVKSQKYKEMLKQQEDLQKLNEIKKQIVKETKITKKRQFNNEVLNLFNIIPIIILL